MNKPSRKAGLIGGGFHLRTRLRWTSPEPASVTSAPQLRRGKLDFLRRAPPSIESWVSLAQDRRSSDSLCHWYMSSHGKWPMKKGPLNRRPFLLVAPRDGLEPSTKWLIPPQAGLYPTELSIRNLFIPLPLMCRSFFHAELRVECSSLQIRVHGPAIRRVVASER